ncbi:ABC transporter ATP-binding protein [Fusibacillus kribbianus]|uniref:ABC transporter ATP-binding protein n=1 Tax=Fusibacillus kribbianus TaxID=3044208 RepID=A0AAP4EXC5_9FIRM|nr:ABC transporter ATP-binding protein [Ruminococcus sp. YH-rum2234]MDI9241647.1 ABC transporter ATP-binding protein [Ruminococcus sp. YH-rum2234]
MKKLFSIENMDVCYGDSPVLRGVSMSVDKGEILGIVGESGSGKSTTIYASLGILGKGGRVTGGSIRYEDRELLKLSEEEMRRLRGKEISLIAQNPVESFHPIRKIRSQLKELIKCHGGLSFQEAEEQMLAIMEKINLKDGKRILNSYAFEMSGGMCQRVSIAMAMVLSPMLLFADEPTSALDVTVQKQVVGELLKLREDFGTAVFLVSHNMGVISHMADTVAVMYGGMVLEYGKKDLVIRNALHPYTKNLIQAVPSMDKPAPKGVLSAACDRSAPGCPYRNGCSCKKEQCEELMPGLQEAEPGHFVRCFFV